MQPGRAASDSVAGSFGGRMTGTDTQDQSCVIVGASHAGAQLALSLRRDGWEGAIVLIGEEDCLPYHRPPLSKDYLSGSKSFESILIRKADAYEKAGVDVRLGVRVEAIDRQAKSLALSTGETLAYDKLALAIGARVRRIPVPGLDKAGVYGLRTVADIAGIQNAASGAGKAVIVGGGYIGLETAASLRKMGLEVTVLEMLPRVLGRVTAPEVSAFYTRVHREEGVEILTGAGVSEIVGGGAVAAVRCADGSEHPADLVILGTGIVPNVELAEAAGLKVGNGIVVDACARTSDPDIVAAGDCTFHPSALYGGDVRLESVQNATDQAKTASATICGKPEPYAALPWFWSDQFDLKLQIAGLSQGYDDLVIRGDIAGSRSFSAWYFAGEKLLAVDAVNDTRSFMLAKKLLTTGTPVNKSIIADPAADLKASLLG